jgi:alpha-galactosidase
VHQVRLNPIINGWCSWFYSHEYINEDEVMRNADFAARQLKPYGLEHVQIDADWFRSYGDWEGNHNFPHGMKWLAARIRDLGLGAGVWLAPYCISEGTDVFGRHQDWPITDRDGRPKQCGGGLPSPQIGEGYGVPSLMKKIYGLDVTHPGAAGWLRDLFKTVADDWGYDFIKIDFVEWTLLSADRYHDPAFSKAVAYRRGFEIIRDAVGPTCHLLDCGPMNCTLGLLDSARIEMDLPRLTWEQYTGNFNSSAPVDQELRVRVEPQSVALFSVHPHTEIPRVISTDRHFTQGAVELEDVRWDPLSNTVSGTSRGPSGTAHNISVYVPVHISLGQ